MLVCRGGQYAQETLREKGLHTPSLLESRPPDLEAPQIVHILPAAKPRPGWSCPGSWGGLGGADVGALRRGGLSKPPQGGHSLSCLPCAERLCPLPFTTANWWPWECWRFDGQPQPHTRDRPLPSEWLLGASPEGTDFWSTSKICVISHTTSPHLPPSRTNGKP